MSKPIWASKTFWANIFALAASVGGGYGLGLDAEVQASLVGGVMAVVNIILRMITSSEVTLK